MQERALIAGKGITHSPHSMHVELLLDRAVDARIGPCDHHRLTSKTGPHTHARRIEERSKESSQASSKQHRRVLRAMAPQKEQQEPLLGEQEETKVCVLPCPPACLLLGIDRTACCLVLGHNARLAGWGIDSGMPPPRSIGLLPRV